MQRTQQHPKDLRSGLFQLGEVRITLEAGKILAGAQMDATPLLVRHVSGDWGEVEVPLAKRNDKACQKFAPVESRHRVAGWLLSVLTDGQRRRTAVCLAEEARKGMVWCHARLAECGEGVDRRSLRAGQNRRSALPFPGLSTHA